MSASWTERKRPITSFPSKLVSVIAAVVLVMGCNRTEPRQAEQATSLSYATQFQLSDNSVTVLEAWPGAAPKKYTIPSKPPSRIICTSTTHLHSLELLGLEDKLVGFANLSYISSSRFRERAAEGLITDVGSDGSLNLELIIGLQPDLVIAFDAMGNSGDLDRIAAAGIPVVLNADFMETSALGRAEWIKFFGALLNKRDRADSIFRNIEQDYQALLSLTEHITNRPGVLSGNVYGDTWFMPGGLNNSAKFFDDAGGTYLWEDDPNTGWLELSFESVFEQARDADYWIGMGSFSSLEEIETQDARYADFKAFQNGNVYNYDNRQVPEGGNDYFESGYTRPDLILADLIHIIQPDVLPNHELYYFRKLL